MTTKANTERQRARRSAMDRQGARNETQGAPSSAQKTNNARHYFSSVFVGFILAPLFFDTLIMSAFLYSPCFFCGGKQASRRHTSPAEYAVVSTLLVGEHAGWKDAPWEVRLG